MFPSERQQQKTQPNKQTKTYRHAQQYRGYQKEGWWWGSKGSGVKYMVTKDDLNLGGKHTMQCIDDVL